MKVLKLRDESFSIEDHLEFLKTEAGVKYSKNCQLINDLTLDKKRFGYE